MCFPLRMERVDKETQFWDKDKYVLSSAHRTEDPLEYCDYL